MASLNPADARNIADATSRDMWFLFASLCGVVAIDIVFYIFLSPKSPQRNINVTCAITAATSLWLMWAITFLAQINPYIIPKPYNKH